MTNTTLPDRDSAAPPPKPPSPTATVALMPRSIVAAYTHVDRAAVFAETRAAFEAVGLPIRVTSLQLERPRHARNRRNAREALKRALEDHLRPRELPGVLLVEDDVTPANTLPAWLEVIERTQARPVALYTPTVERWYPQRLHRVVRGERKATKSEIATINPAAVQTWWGAQAIWLPTAWAEIVVRDPRIEAHEATIGPWDHALRTLIGERGATLGVAIPHVIQHRDERNMITPTKQPSTSASYQRSAPAPTR